MLYTKSPTGSLLRQKIDEFNSTTTGLIMTMVNIVTCHDYDLFIKKRGVVLLYLVLFQIHAPLLYLNKLIITGDLLLKSTKEVAKVSCN